MQIGIKRWHAANRNVILVGVQYPVPFGKVESIELPILSIDPNYSASPFDHMGIGDREQDTSSAKDNARQHDEKSRSASPRAALSIHYRRVEVDDLAQRAVRY